MIFAASLALVAKQAMGDKCRQSSINYIIDNMPLDPDVTKMEIVLLSARDLEGPFKARVQEALESRHPDVCVIYFYTNDKEKAMLDAPYSKGCKKIKAPEVKDAIQEFYGEHAIKTHKLEVESIDKTAFTVTHEEKERHSTPSIPDTPIEDDTPIVEEKQNEEEEAVEEPTSMPLPVEVPEEPEPKVGAKREDSVEDKISRVKKYTDWDVFKKALNQDSLTRQLIQENTEYQGICNMLEVWDVKITATFKDPVLTTQEKFDKIKEFGKQRTILKASENSIYCQRLSNVLAKIVECASRTVDERINELQESVYKITSDQKNLLEETNMQTFIENRLNIQVELVDMLGSLTEAYALMDTTVKNKLETLTEGLPSSNAYISEMMSPLKEIFLPTNTSGLATMLMQSLQEGRVTMSALEQKINNMIALVFKLAEADNEIIAYQQNVINMLKAQRVEDIVIRDSLIKDCLRVFIGQDSTGRTATSLAWAGMMSRRYNTLVVDLSPNSKMESYGVKTYTIDEFYAERKHEQLMVVKADFGTDAEKLYKLMQELRNRLDYYPCICVVLDNTQTDFLNQLTSDALTVNYITDCTTRSVDAMREVIKKHNAENIARRLVTIDTPVDALSIMKKLELDPMGCKLVPIPYLRDMKACALNEELPHTVETILTVFEEAFR